MHRRMVRQLPPDLPGLWRLIHPRERNEWKREIEEGSKSTTFLNPLLVFGGAGGVTRTIQEIDFSRMIEIPDRLRFRTQDAAGNKAHRLDAAFVRAWNYTQWESREKFYMEVIVGLGRQVAALLLGAGPIVKRKKGVRSGRR